MTNDTSLESSCALLLESAKKIANFPNLIFIFAQLKKICPKNEKWYIFENPLAMPFQICKILNNLIFNQEKLKMCKFPLTGSLQKICNFFRKTCAIRFLMSKAFQKAKFYQIWQVEVGQNKDLVCYSSNSGSVPEDSGS